MIWHIWWLAAVSFVIVLAAVVARGFVDDEEYTVSPDQIAALEGRGSGPLLGY
jgi:cytochrome o ubiquinol oxidase subunit 1